MCANKAVTEAGFVDISDLADPVKTALLDCEGNGKGEVFIGVTGWGSTAVEHARGLGYGDDQVVDLVELVESVAYAQLAAAITACKPLVGFCYKPHHLFTVHPEMPFLTEPAHDPAVWKIVTPEQDPEWKTASNVAMAWAPVFIHPAFSIGLNETAPQVASEWIAANPDRVTAWFKLSITAH